MADVRVIKERKFPRKIKQVLINGIDVGDVFSINYTPGEPNIVIDLPIGLYTEEYENDETTNKR